MAEMKTLTINGVTYQIVATVSEKEIQDAIESALAELPGGGLTAGQVQSMIDASLEGFEGGKGEPGKDGVDGKDGEDGYTPVRGVDYWTEEDKAEIKSYIDEALAELPTAEELPSAEEVAF